MAGFVSCADWKDTHGSVVICLDEGLLTLTPQTDNAIRVKFAAAGALPDTVEELIFTESVATPDYKVSDKNGRLTVALSKISAVFDRKTRALQFYDAGGRLLLQELEGGRTVVPDSIQGQPTYCVEQRFVSPSDEHLFGTGQFQDGYVDVRGLTRRLTQVNTQISLPFILSDKGYGLLWHNYGLTDFNPADSVIALTAHDGSDESVTVSATSTGGSVREKRNFRLFTGEVALAAGGRYSLLLDVGQRMARKHYLSIDGENLTDVNNIWLPPTTSLIRELSAGQHTIEVRCEENDSPVLRYRPVGDETVWRSPVATSIDYTVFAGFGDEVSAAFRTLSGQAPMMPLWALGYIHCRERFHSQEEILTNVREFRSRQLPIDVVVQDWQYWGDLGWNAMQFDLKDYPDPKALVEDLHAMNTRLMISVWSRAGSRAMHSECREKGYYIGKSDWVDFFNPDAAACYWRYFTEGLVQPFHIDAWWQDATEPENDDLQGRMVRAGTLPGEVVRNVYPLFVNRTVYENFRRDEPGKRTMILTRSGFSGMHRYATATWSGDVGNDWETLRSQIAGGLGQMAAGLPWWTYDAGGFFRPGDGQYTNPQYHERFLRWFEAATFLPLQRVHGYGTQTEFWRFGREVESVSRRFLNFRYRLLPYIYSRAAAVTFDGSTLMRPLVMDFADDPQAMTQRHEFMFGPTLLVAPVVEPSVKEWPVYLPKNPAGWVDFNTGRRFEGGQTVNVAAPIDAIPLFARGGSILVLGEEKQYSEQNPDAPLEIRIYPGADATFSLYEDDGVSYDYENSNFATTKLSWNDSTKTLTVGARQGSFNGMVKNRKLNIILVEEGKGTGMGNAKNAILSPFNGEEIVIKL
jgi:alpha-D-xyloside xylohydrolase